MKRKGEDWNGGGTLSKEMKGKEMERVSKGSKRKGELGRERRGNEME